MINKKRLENKNKYLLIIGIFALVGAIFIVPLMLYFNEPLDKLEAKICKPALQESQTDRSGTPYCEKLTEDRIRDVWGGFCEDGKLYYIDKGEPCIARVVLFPFYPWSQDVHPDAGMAFLPLVLIYGAFLGGIIGGLICGIIHIKRRHNKKDG